MLFLITPASPSLSEASDSASTGQHGTNKPEDAQVRYLHDELVSRCATKPDRIFCSPVPDAIKTAVSLFPDREDIEPRNSLLVAHGLVERLRDGLAYERGGGTRSLWENHAPFSDRIIVDDMRAVIQDLDLYAGDHVAIVGGENLLRYLALELVSAPMGFADSLLLSPGHMSVMRLFRHAQWRIVGWNIGLK